MAVNINDVSCPVTSNALRIRCIAGGYWRVNDPGIPLTETPGPKLDGSDWAHTNSLFLDGTGDWFLSLNNLSWLVKMDPYETSAPDWELYGDSTDTGDAWDPVSSPTYDVDFDHQHHPRFISSDQIMMFDNNGGGPLDSRGITLELDTMTWTYDVVAEYDTGLTCPQTGSAVDVTLGGNVMTTCSDDGVRLNDVIQEFDVSGGSPVWAMTLSCTSGANYGTLYRARPLFDLDI